MLTAIAEDTLVPAPHSFIVTVHDNGYEYEQEGLHGVNADQSVDLPVIAAIARNDICLDKNIDSLEQVEGEQQSYVGDEGNLGEAWVIQQIKEAVQEDRDNDCSDHRLDQAAEDHARILQHEKLNHCEKNDLIQRHNN